jgi:hypothetical protein
LVIRGVHKHRVRWCACKDDDKRHLMLFKMGLFSASIERPKTAFTFQCLDYFHLDSMECRTPANFFNKLRRLTNNTFPESVSVRVKKKKGMITLPLICDGRIIIKNYFV